MNYLLKIFNLIKKLIMSNTNAIKGPKGIKTILYPNDDTTLRFTSKDYTGYITLDNATGSFTFSPDITVDLTNYVTLNGVQTITASKIFEDNVNFNDSVNITKEGTGLYLFTSDSEDPKISFNRGSDILLMSMNLSPAYVPHLKIGNSILLHEGNITGTNGISITTDPNTTVTTIDGEGTKGLDIDPVDTLETTSYSVDMSNEHLQYLNVDDSVTTLNISPSFPADASTKSRRVKIILGNGATAITTINYTGATWKFPVSTGALESLAAYTTVVLTFENRNDSTIDMSYTIDL